MTSLPDLRWGTRTFADLGGTRVHVETAAGPGTTAVVGLHGFASGTFTWAGIADGVTQRAPLVAWDRPPFGRSDRPMPARGAADPYRLEAELHRTRALVEDAQRTVSADGVVLIGHSAGALLAVQAVRAGLPGVRGVVLVAPALAGEPPTLVRRLARAPGAGRLGPAALGVALRGAGPALRAMTRHPSPLLTATAAESAAALRRPGTASALWHLTSTWRPPDLDDLAPLGVPTLVIAGADDRISPPGPTRATAERLGAAFELLDDVGHAPHEQAPDDVVELIGDLLDEVG